VAAERITRVGVADAIEAATRAEVEATTERWTWAGVARAGLDGAELNGAELAWAGRDGADATAAETDVLADLITAAGRNGRAAAPGVGPDGQAAANLAPKS
jgi:hypothetical protein